MTQTQESTSTPVTATVPAVWPCVAYRDPAAALAFLTTAFGLTERAVYRDGDTLVHVELSWSTLDGKLGGVMFGDTCETEPDRAPFGNATVHVVVDDADARYATAVAAGARIVRELEDTDYGSRMFVARDPEGNVWSFGTWYE